MNHQGRADALKDAIIYAIATNAEVRASIANRAMIEYDRRIVGGALFPNIYFSSTYGNFNKESGASPLLDKDSQTADFAATLDWDLFQGWDTVHELTYASMKVDSATFRVEEKIEAIAFTVAEAYLNVLKQKEYLALCRANLRKHEEILENIRQRFEEGLNPLSDERQASERMLLVETQYLDFEQQLRDALAVFRRYVDYDVDVFSAPQDFSDSVPQTEEAILHRALANNLSLKALQAEVEGTYAQYDQSSAPFLPSLKLIVEHRKEWDRKEKSYSNDSLEAKLQLRYDVFNGFQDVYKRSRALRQIDYFSHGLENQNRKIRQDVSRYWAGYQKHQLQKGKIMSHTHVMRQVRDLYKKEFLIGKKNLLSVLDAESDLFNAQIAQLNNILANILSGYQLLWVMGDFLRTYDISRSVAVINVMRKEEGEKKITKSRGMEDLPF